MESDRQLDETLHGTPLRAVQFAPDVFQRLVGGKEISRIEERDPFREFVLGAQRKTHHKGHKGTQR